MAPAQTGNSRRRISLLRALFSRRVLDRRITSASTLAGLILGAVIGTIAGSFLAGVWIGLIVGFEAPGPVAFVLDRAGALPESALYKRLAP